MKGRFDETKFDETSLMKRCLMLRRIPANFPLQGVYFNKRLLRSQSSGELVYFKWCYP